MTHPTSWNDDTLATFKPEALNRMHEWMERHDLNGNPTRGSVHVYIEDRPDGQIVVRWWPAVSLNEKARIFCREYIKDYPSNDMARTMLEALSAPGCGAMDPKVWALHKVIQFVRQYED
jgi:hypothetical protein